MWLELCFAIISCIFLLYVPGLIGAASWSSRIDETVAFAPIISVTSYCFAGLVLSLVGVFASAATIIPFALAWCLAVYLVGRLIRRPASPRDASLVGIVVVYVCIAILVSFFVFILPLDGPGSFVQTYDNVHQYRADIFDLRRLVSVQLIIVFRTVWRSSRAGCCQRFLPLWLAYRGRGVGIADGALSFSLRQCI